MIKTKVGSCLRVLIRLSCVGLAFLLTTPDATSQTQDKFFSTRPAVPVAADSSSLADSHLSADHITRYVFNEDDIRQSCARDLLELVSSIPDISVGVDVQGTLTIGVRGSQAGEAFALFVDSVQLNEALYATFHQSGKLQLDQLRRVEVVIGPNAVNRGTMALYGSIYITTRASRPFTGIRTAWTQGFHNASTDARVGTSFSFGKVGPSWNVTLSGSVNNSVMSFGRYTDLSGNGFIMSSSSAIQSRFASAQVRFRRSYVHLLSDVYSVFTRDGFINSTTQAYRNEYNTWSVLAGHQLVSSRRLNLAVEADFRSQDPWRTISEIAPADTGAYFQMWMRASKGSVGSKADWKISDRLTLAAAVSAYREQAYVMPGFTYSGVSDLRGEFTCTNASARLRYQSRTAFLSIGGRYDRHSQAGSLPALELYYTQKVGAMRLQLSYSDVYRTPALMNYLLAADPTVLKAQRLVALESALIYQGRAGWQAGLAGYRYQATNPVSYTVDANGVEGYVNSGDFGVAGGRLFAQGGIGKLRLKASYTYYRTAKSMSRYTVLGKDENLAFPQHRATLQLGGKLYKDFEFSCLANVFGQKSGVVGLDTTQAEQPPVYQTYPAKLTLNAFLHFKVAIAQGLSCSLGVVDILNQGVQFVQPYAGLHMPLPGPAREYVIRICYAIER